MECKKCGSDKKIKAMGLCRKCYMDDLDLRKNNSKHACTYCGNKPVKAKGLCSACYDYQRKNGTPQRRKREVVRCTYCGEKPYYAKGLCRACYYQIKRHGTLNRRLCVRKKSEMR